MASEEKRSVWLIARELAEAVAESPELQEYRSTEDAVLQSQEAVELVRRYERQKRDVKASKYKSPQEQNQLIEEFMATEAEYDAHSIIQAHWRARERLDAFLDRINAVVTFPITGEEQPKVKGGACGSGGGGGCGCGG